MRLAIKWNEFSQSIDTFVTEGEGIIVRQKDIRTEQELENVKLEMKSFKTRCYEFLQNSFNDDSNEIAHEFFYSGNNHRPIIPGRARFFEQTRKEVFDDFNSKLNDLKYYKRVLAVSDAIVRPESVDIGNRANWITEQVLELILDKLYDLYDNNYHSVRFILHGNGIVPKRDSEEKELIRVLEEDGYIDAMFTRDPTARLTIEGKMHVEEKRKTFKENYDDIHLGKEEMDNRIDEIIEQLTKLGCGQQIIFEEIEELKTLYTTLNKKNWGQVVKGKLLDLALAKLVENDTISYIYHKLTDHVLRLP